MSCCSFYAQTLDDLNGSHKSLLTSFKCVCICMRVYHRTVVTEMGKLHLKGKAMFL